MKGPLESLVKVFKPDGFDWMNFVLSKSNPYTYHHIIKKCDGGEKSVDNGAILTRKAHTFLHKLERVCPDAYNDLQSVFVKINESKIPPDDEIIREIDDILYKLLISHEYEILEDIDLSSYCSQYSQGRKELKKCLK